jgi:hypothetical protein
MVALTVYAATLPANMKIRDGAPNSKKLEQPDNDGNNNDGVQN